MARAPVRTCPNLYRLIDGAEADAVIDFLGEEAFRRYAWLDPYRDDATRKAGRPRLMEMLHREKKARLEPLEIEAARVLTVAEPRGETALEGLARTKLRPPELSDLNAQRDALSRSLWAWLHHRMLFEATESVLHIRFYRRYGKHYQSFRVPPRGGQDGPSREGLDAMIADIEARLDRGSGCTLERFDLPARGEHPASEMYILYHPKPLTSARDVDEDGERRTLYIRPPGEATIVFTPSTGVIEVRADTRPVRRMVAESFAETVLEEDLSNRPLEHRDYDLSRFFGGFSLDCPEIEGAMIRRAQVIKAEVSLRHLGNRLSLATTIDEDMDDLIASEPGLSRAFARAVAIRFVEIAVRYVPSGETEDRTLDFSITDLNTCGLLSLPDERERVLGHRLLHRWGILRELRSMQDAEARQTLPVLLELWNAGMDHVPGSWLRQRGVDPATLTTTGFLEPVGWAEVDLIEEDGVGPTDARVVAEDGRSRLEVSPGQLADGGPPVRYRRFRIERRWLIEHLRTTVSGALDTPLIEELSPDLYALGTLSVDGAAVPVHLARRLDRERVLADSDIRLRARGDRGLGLVLAGGDVAFRCLGANVLCPLSDHLGEDESGLVLDAGSMRMAFSANRHLARGGQAVELVWDGGASGELYVPGKGSIQIPGRTRLIVVDRLVKAYKRGSPKIMKRDLMGDISDMSMGNLFGKKHWPRLEGRFIRSAGDGLWEIAA